MKNREDLRNQIRKTDHKSYGMYKSLSGSYHFGSYILHIDHVQGDPFASPSRLRVEVGADRHGFPEDYYQDKSRRLALEDRVLRLFHRELKKRGGRSGGSGKSGRISTCPVGQTVQERIAVHFSGEKMEFLFEMGFPARGRTILGKEMEDLVFETIPDLVVHSFFYNKWYDKDKEALKAAIDLADDQKTIRLELEKRGLIAFLADGSVLPRESGVSDRPLKDAVAFSSPESLRVALDLPHKGRIYGMGIPEGISVIVGGGYHGKSTLLKALEQGVYNHIAGDGREYVITREHAMKIRAEDGRSVSHTDISLFIRNLPGGQGTEDFSTENASGSTSQAANLMEAIEAGSGVLLLDEDTSATNFMIRDQVMARLVSDDREPISTLLKSIRGMCRNMQLSFVIVVGSSGDYLSVADLVLALDHYQVRDVTGEAGLVCREAGIEGAYPETEIVLKERKRSLCPMSYDRLKMKAGGTDTVVIDRENIDVRYLEQLTENGQTICLAYLMGEIIRSLKRETGLVDLVEDLYRKIDEKGLSTVIPKGYPLGQPVLVRKQELYACINRYRKAGLVLRHTL